MYTVSILFIINCITINIYFNDAFLSRLNSPSCVFRGRIALYAVEGSKPKASKGYFRLPNDDKDDEDGRYGIFDDLSVSSADLGRIFPLDGTRRQLVLNEMVDAFDNLPYSEVDEMLQSICNAQDADTMAQLLNLTAQMDQLYAELKRRNNTSAEGMEDLDDASRVIRSRIRMYVNWHIARSGDGDRNTAQWPW